MAVLPAYLSSSTTLIKSLKATQDPPQHDFPSKIEIAQEAWQHEGVYVPRKAEVLREWVVESWSRTGKGKGKETSVHPILVPGYHRLLLDVSQRSAASTSSTTISPPLTILQSLFSLPTSQPVSLNELIVLAQQSMALLFPLNSTAYKAEAWTEAWTAMVSFVATVDQGSLDPAAEVALRKLAELVSKSTVTSLSGSQNRRKIAQASFTVLPSLGTVLRAHPYLADVLQPAFTPIYLPLPVLQSHSPTPMGLLLPAIPSSPLLLPTLLSAYIAAVQASRYTLFPPPTSSKLPPDVYVAGMVRNAVHTALGDIMRHIDNVSCFEARFGIWDVVRNWGGYLEGEATWTSLLASEGRRVERALRDGTDSAEWVLKTCAILVSLDHAAADVNEEVVGFCLQAGNSAKAVFSSLVTFHTLTHTVPAFFTLLASSIESLFTPVADHAAVYSQVAGGILTSSWLAREVARMLRSGFVGGKRGRVWAEVVGVLQGALKQAEDAKRQSPGTEVRFASAETMGLLSRVLGMVVEAAIGVDDANEAATEAAASLNDWTVPLHAENKKRKAPTVDEIELAARVRLSRMASRLAYAGGSTVSDDLADVVSALETSTGEAAFELAEWVVQILSTMSLGEDDKSTASRAVDALLAQVKTAPTLWTGRVSMAASSPSGAMWCLLAERGLVLLDLIATSEQLTVLASSLVDAFDESGAAGAVIIRVLSTAEFWELARFRVALLQRIRLAATADDATALKAFAIAGYCPTSYLSKNLRGALVDTAYALDRKAVNAGLRRFLLRLAVDFSVLGPLATDISTLDHFMTAPSGETRDVTRALLSKAFDAISPDVTRQLVELCKTRKPFAAVSKALKKGKQVELDDASFSALLLLESQKQPEPELTSLAVKSLDAAVGRIVEGAVDAAAAPLLEAWAGLLPVAQRAGVLDQCITNRTAKLVAKSSDIGVACMRVAVAEAAVTGNHSLVLAAYVAIASHGVSEQLDAVFVPDAASYAAQLEDIAAALSACAFRPRLLALLQAAKVLVRARVEGSGQAVAEFVAKVLITLQSLHGSDVTLSMLELVETIVTERIVQIQLSDVTLVWDLLLKTLLPSHAPRADVTRPQILHHALNVVYTLARHRPDLALATLPLVTAFLSAMFAVLQAPRESLGGKVRARAVARWPAWISKSHSIGEDEAKRFARVLTTLCSRSSRTAAAGEERISLAGPFSKHAPAVLVAYVRAVADPTSGLSTAVRKELEPGLFALCEVITAGGRAEGREGEGVGEAFGLGEVTADAEREVWADLWRRWGKEPDRENGVIMLPTVTREGKATLDALLKDVIESKQLPALFLTACNAEEVIYENQDGWVDFEKQDERVDAETTLHLFSMTKLITSIAIHILVDQGKASLHDADLVGQYLPELAAGSLELLEGWDDEKDEPVLRKAIQGVTLAQLMSHSAGLCYSWSGPPELSKYIERFPRKGLFEKGASIKDYVQPVIYEPGESYRYSIGLDWAGFFIERRTGMSLEAFFVENIFKPLGVKMSFYPKPEIMKHLIKPCALDADTGALKVLPPAPMGKPVQPEDVTVLNGGGGLYGTTRDYFKVLQAVLRSKGGYENPLLSPESYKSLFTGVLEPAGVDKLHDILDDIWYHAPVGRIQHSPGLLLYTDGGEYGRKPGSGCWDGAMKTIFWIDPETGIAAECNTNVLANKNNNAIGRTVRKFEQTLYEALK